MLGLARPAPAASVDWRLRLPASPSQLGRARAFAHEAAEACGLGADRAFELVHAVNEAVTNAIRHGAPDEHGLIHLHASACGRRLTIAVRDFGRFAMPAPQRPEPAEGGRGMALIARFTDHAAISVHAGATVVLLSKDLG